jgi:tetratricopeptide (TPR) repeat protein
MCFSGCGPVRLLSWLRATVRLRDSWGGGASLAGFLGLALVVPMVTKCAGQLPPGWSLEIESALERGESQRALQLADAAVGQASESSQVHLVRGMVRFRLGQIEASLADFDRSIALDPRSGPHNWQRGIALYYAGRYADGAAQFEEHREVNPNDVENSAWHFLCVAKLRGVERARAELIPSGGDGRRPMMKVLELYAGRASVQDVLDEAERSRRWGSRSGVSSILRLPVHRPLFERSAAGAGSREFGMVAAGGRYASGWLHA